MKKIIYNYGETIGALKYLRESRIKVFSGGSRNRYCIFRCDCGKEFEACIDNVKKERTSSCGCKTISLIKIANTKHNKSKTRIYKQWRSMKERCYLQNIKSFKHYGGRGILVCDEWKDNFLAYYEWAVKNGYADNLTIDRINNDGNYEPSNCRFTTYTIQARNTRKLTIANTSGYRGVNRNKNRWIARIQVDSKSIFLGLFFDKIEAARVYDKYVIDNNLEHTRNFND